MLGVKRAYFPKHERPLLPFILIGGQNRNISKLKGQKVQLSLCFIYEDIGGGECKIW